ncbi:sensor histidine kinase [Spirillospora sp. CA-294931]|uniref:sensor histidine kinase n=1 Tax=Spirillospora sp. CA-294931 TaxID=3240042 RepID=UPI003D8F4A23
MVAPVPSRPRVVPWLATFLYATVLVAGLYGELVGLCEPDPLGTAGFTAALVAAAALERLRPGGRAREAALLAARAGLFAAAAALDCSGTARSLFLLIPFVGYFTLGRRAGYALAVLCLGAVTVALASRPGWYSDSEGVSDLLMFVIGLVFAIAMAAAAHREEAGRARAEALAGQVRELATVAERHRLARDIHDNVGHHLTVIAVQLEKAEAFRDLDRAAADQALRDARESARIALGEVRRSVGGLRSQGEVFSLSSALAALVARFGDGVTLDIDGEETRFAGGPALYHAAQESLTNATRHAAAGRVTVEVSLGRREARLVVADDGRGFGSDADEGFGMRGMRERLELVGGTLRIESAPGAGTRVTAVVPVRP